MEHIYKQFEALATKWRRDLLLRARVKFTAAYVGVSVIVLAVFSYLLYNALLTHLTESINEDVLNFTARELFFERASSVVLSQILMADGIALIFVILCGYILTGITLRPIRKAREREHRFLADAAHELRTPLSVMKSGNEVVLRGEADMSSRLKRLLTENVEEIDSLTRIANGLLSLVNEKEKAVKKGLLVNMHHVLSGVVKKLESIAHTRQVRLTFIAEEPTKTFTVRADQDALARAFQNIVENAIKYTKTDGSVEVSLTGTGGSIIIQVRDNGIGISADDLPHVTEPFYRADAARMSKDGSGLGLSIVSETIESHGGQFTIQSELGVGTTVTVKLPIAKT